MLATRFSRCVLVVAAGSVTFAGCARGADVSTATAVAVSSPTAATTDGVAPNAATAGSAVAPATPAPTAPKVAPPTQPPPTATTPAPPASTSPVTTQPSGSPGVPLGGGSTPHRLPTDDPGASWGDSHNYPAVDIFVSGDDGCGGNVVSPVNGTVSQIRTTDKYDPDTDNPAFRGGKSATVIGDDGVRYYMSHFDSIDANVQPGLRVAIGDRLGIVGTTGRSGACHIHFGISPPCPDLEWSVRRGVIDPEPFVSSWRDGGDASPVEAVQQWLNDNPDGCAAASADPNASEA